MIFVITFLPFIVSLTILLFGRFFNQLVVKLLLSCSLLFCFFGAVKTFLENVIFGVTLIHILPFEWISLSHLAVEWSFVYDSVSCTMMLVVFFISGLVQLYSFEYMNYDPHLFRYLAYLNLFTFFMILLLTSGNFLQMFFGWEGVGLCSYLLVNFWYTRIQANKSAFKAMIVNRVGDWFFAVAIGLCFVVFGSVDCFFISSLAQGISTLDLKIAVLNFEFGLIEMVAFFFVFGVFAKSAQFGLHTWLPDAMEGPTPVSALIHAATMVTAGVFLVIRCNCLFENASVVLFIIALFGAVTAISASLIACFQADLKKIIAYSTCSQLGYMLFSCGLSLYSTALFHFLNHAFFKALLFLGAGAIIHSVYGEQDSEVIEGLDDFIPFTAQLFSIACLVLASYPFLGAFYSKDWILEVVYGSYYIDGVLFLNLVLHAAVYTAVYANDLMGVFDDEDDEEGFSDSFTSLIVESGWLILTCLSILTVVSIFSGFLFKDIFIGVGSAAFSDSIFVSLLNQVFFECDYISTNFKMFPFYCSFFVSFIFSNFVEDQFLKNILNFGFTRVHSIFMNFTVFLSDFFELLWLYNSFINTMALKFLGFCNFFVFKMTDKGLFELLGPDGLVMFVVSFIKDNLFSYVSGFLYHYSFFMIFGLILFLLVSIFFNYFLIFEYFGFMVFASLFVVFNKFL